MTATRREALQLGAVGALGVAGLSHLGRPLEADALAEKGKPSKLRPQNRPVPFRGVFMRPPELEPFARGFDDEEAPGEPVEKYAVTARLGQLNILPGLATTVAGYNGIFPGPTLRITRGVRSQLRVRNAFPPAGLIYPQQIELSTHLHGSPSKPQFDGYANDITVPGNVKNYHYPNDESARTLWYHDHRHIVTTQNVYSGLAALYPMHDQFEQAQLPQGEFDVPFIVSDALFHADGSLAFNDNGHLGNWGDIILVNGVAWPTMRVKPRIYRFRWLTATVARSFRPTLSNGDPLHMVGTDGGMTPIVQAVPSFRTGSAERYEFLIDFRGFRTGQSVDLLNLSPKNNLEFRDIDKIARFEVVDDSGPASTFTSIPTRLDRGAPVPGTFDPMTLQPGMATVKRELVFEHQHGEWVINGTTWADVENAEFLLLEANPRPFAVEQWTITNKGGGWFHPVHIHLVDGKIIARNTNGGKPFPWEGGPKDVYYAGENESVTALIQFDIQPGGEGRFMIHCHNVTHEDHDMMVQFSAGNERANDPIHADPPLRDPLPLTAFPPVYRPQFPPGT
jgi:FtsP/CotA-like multicopper oxidase with cupredoxin domain